MKSFEEMKEYLASQGTPVLKKLGRQVENRNKGFLNSSTSILKILIPALFVTMYFLFKLFFQNDEAVIKWVYQILIVDAMLSVLLVIFLYKGEYPVVFSPSVASDFLNELTKYYDNSLSFRFSEGMSEKEFDNCHLPLVNNLEKLKVLPGKKASEKYFFPLGRWQRAGSSEYLDVINTGIKQKRGGFVYKGIIFKGILPDIAEGKHILYSDLFEKSMGKSIETMNEKQRLDNCFLGSDWNQFSSHDNGLSENNKTFFKKAFFFFSGRDDLPGVYLSCRGQSFYVWFDYNSLGYDPVLFSREHQNEQLEALFSVLKSYLILSEGV